MSNLVPTNVQLPAHLSSRMGQASSITGAMSSGISVGGDAPNYKRISKRNSRFRIVDGKDETVLPSDTLRTIIVGAGPVNGVNKVFYKKWDPDAEDKKPDCYSNLGVVPEADAKDPQAQSCGNCPKNAWGSKITEAGKKMKACADQKRLAVISADDHSEEPEVYLYTVTPSELTDFANYGKQLASKGIPPEMCVTELSFDTKASHPKMQFKFGGFVTESQVATIDKLVISDIVKEIIGGEQAVVAEVIEAPKPKKPAVTVKVEPAYVPPPVVIEDAVYEEVVPVADTPKATKGFGSAAVAKEPAPVQAVKSSNLAMDIQSILADMEEDDE